MPVVGVLATATPAAAHAVLEETQPVSGAIVASSPRQVVLHFGEPVEIDLGSIRVFGPKDQRVDHGGTHHPPADTHSVAISLPRLASGTYVVAWRVISADSHPVHGAFLFSVGLATRGSAASSLATNLATQSGSQAVGVAFWLVRLAEYAGLVGLVGVPVVLLITKLEGQTARSARRVLWAAWALLLGASLASIALQGVYASALPITDVWEPSLIWSVVHTRFGELTFLRLVLLLVATPWLLRLVRSADPRPPRAFLLVGGLLGLSLLVVVALAGHAATGVWVPLGISVDIVHLGAVAVWLGALTVLALALFGPDGAFETRRELALSVSSVALAAVTAIVITGVLQAIRQVGSLQALADTTYGRTLLVKVGLVVMLLSIAVVSRRALHGHLAVPLMGRLSIPRQRWRTHRKLPADGGTERSRVGLVPVLDPSAGSSGESSLGIGGVAVMTARRGPCPEVDDGERLRRLRRSVTAELAVALGVLAVASLLVNAPPARAVEAQPYAQSFTVSGVQANVIIAPARAGVYNQFHLYLLAPSGAPVTPPEVDVSLSLPSQGIGPLLVALLPAGPGHYIARQIDIPAAGDWQLKLLVRTSAIDEGEIYATVPVH